MLCMISLKVSKFNFSEGSGNTSKDVFLSIENSLRIQLNQSKTKFLFADKL